MNETKITLKDEYEKIAGVVSDRQWRRIKRLLEISDALTGRQLLQSLPLVRTYAYLRLANRNQKVTLDDVRAKAWVDEFASGMDCTIQGSDLEAALRRLKPSPSLPTLHRWGKEIGVPFSRHVWYSPEEVRKWIARATLSTRFKYPTNELKRA